MRITALIAVAAILTLSLGGLVYYNDKSCCGSTLPFAASATGAGPCFGLCATVVPVTTPTVGFIMVGWLLFIPFLYALPLRVDPIEKPPA